MDKRFFISITRQLFLFLAYYALLVTLPSAAIQHYNVSGATAGLFTTVLLGAAIVVRPFTSRWIEQHGKQAIFLISLLIFVCSSIAYSFFSSIIPLLFIRFIHGLGFGIATTVTIAIVADIVPDSRKGEGIGYFIMSSNLAMVIGPFIGLRILDGFSIHSLFFVSAFFSLSAFLLGCTVRLPKEQQVTPLPGSKKFFAFEKTTIPIAITGAFFSFAYSSVLSFMPVFADERGLAREAGYFFAVYATVLMISRPFTGRWFDAHGKNVIVFPSILLFASGMFCLGMAKEAILFFVAAGLIGMGWGTLFPSFQTIAVQEVEPHRRSVATATFLSIFDIGIGGGSFAAGIFTEKLDIGILYAGSSIYILLGLLVYYWAQKKRAVEIKQASQRQEA
ncbi:MFS transporter [Bacillus sp. PK3_68]|uniref:MFS transporter n=1 Tax=Bacillus sp. PK3_68 TaxID=2027408 RepID=UPI00217DC561|nr:MFS transporter [Bacillus sp. PK3_68]